MNPVSVSMEFFPPKTSEGVEKLRDVCSQLSKYRPAYYSVTFGAAGSTKTGTVNTVEDLLGLGYSAAPHISCLGSTKESIRTLLNQYKAIGVDRLVALRGDLPSGFGVSGTSLDEMRFANELVSFIRDETGNSFHIEVAAYPEMHPQAHSPAMDVQYFVQKVDAGADSAITQYFYNADAYCHFVDEVRQAGCNVPVYPGIMPITNYHQLKRFSDACGAEVPRWIEKKLMGYGNDEQSIRDFGTEVVVNICDRLLKEGVPGLHFYTLNRFEPTSTILDALGIAPPSLDMRRYA